MLRVTAISIVIALCNTGCASSAERAGEPRLRVLPISSLVQPITPINHDLDWDVVLRAHLAGQPAYDAVFRRPTAPVSAVPVMCNKTESIGVYLEARAGSSKKMAQRPLRFTWRHAERSVQEEPMQSGYRQAWLEPRADGVLIYSDQLSLTESRRIDGEWTLDVYHFGEKIFRETFLLMDCDKPNVPEWYAEADLAQVRPDIN